MLLMFCVCHAFTSVQCCPVVSGRERADLLALVFFLCLLFICYFPIWCPGTGVVVDCIDS